MTDTYYNRRCIVCNRTPCDPAHIKTKGSGGDDSENNLMALCREHHTEQHKIGIGTFALKYSNVEEYLEKNGWEVIIVDGINRVRPKHISR